MSKSPPKQTRSQLISLRTMPDKAVIMLKYVIDYFSRVSKPFLTYVQVDAAPHAGVFKIQEESCVGGTLRQVLRAKKQANDRLSEELIWQITYGVLKALVFLHMPTAKIKGLVGNFCFVHGHITPDTIFFTEDQTVKVGYLQGCTLIACNDLRKTNKRYQPCFVLDIDSAVFPPQITPGHEPAVDIWALGQLILQLCAMNEDKIEVEYSLELANFVRELLTDDDRTRPTAIEALQHSRFADIETKYTPQKQYPPNYVQLSQEKNISTKGLIPSSEQVVSLLTPNTPVAPQVELYSSKPRSDLILSLNRYAPGSISDFSELQLGVILDNMEMVKANLSLMGKKTALGMTALMFAGIYNRVDMVPILRIQESGLLCSKMHTAYYYALVAGNLSIADILYMDEYQVEVTANPASFSFSSDNDLTERITSAINQQNLVELHYITMTETQFINQQKSFMHDAVNLNNWQLVLILARFEAKKLNDAGETCLHRAAHLGYAKIVEVLAPYEANIAFHDPTTPGKISFAVNMATANGHAECFDILKFYEHREEYAKKGLLLANSCNTTSLIAAVLSKDYDIIRMRYRDNILSYDKDGYTALMHAVLTNQVEAVLLLLKGVSQVCRNPKHKGLTSLWIAYMQNNAVIVRILAPYEGSSLNPERVTPFEMALREGNLRMLLSLECHVKYPAPTPEALKEKLSELPSKGVSELTYETCAICSPDTILRMTFKDKKQALIPSSASSIPEISDITRSLSWSSTQSYTMNMRSYTPTIRGLQRYLVQLSLSGDAVRHVSSAQSRSLSPIRVVEITPSNAYHLQPTAGMHQDCKYRIKRMQILLGDPSFGVSLPQPTLQEIHEPVREPDNPSYYWFEKPLFTSVASAQDAERISLETGGSNSLVHSPSNHSICTLGGQDLPLIQFDSKITNLMLSVLIMDIFGVLKYRDQMCLQSSNGTTALMLAVSLNSLPMVALLIGEKGIRRYDGLCASDFVRSDAFEIQAILAYEYRCFRDSNGRTPLMQQIMQANTHSRVASSMISRSLDDSVFCASREPMGPVTALGFAIFKGMNRIVQSLLGTNDFYSVFSNYRTPLMIAAIAGRLEIVKLVLMNFVGIRDRDGYTALLIAAHCGHASIVELLLPYEAHLFTVDGLNVVAVAARKNRIKCLEVIYKEYIRYNSLCIYNYLFNTRDNSDMTALMHAATIESLDAFIWLVEHTEEADILMEQKMTPLMYCCENNLYECARELVLRGKGIKCLDSAGRTALMIAAESNNINCVRLLLPFEGKVRGTYQTTALISAVKAGAVEAAELLLCEARLQEVGDYTALYYAIGEYYNDVLINMLLPYEGDLCQGLLEAAIDQFCPWKTKQFYAVLQKYASNVVDMMI